MITKAALRLSAVLLCVSSVISAPTASRTWTSSQGTQIAAVAHGIDAGDVILESATGDLLRVPLEKLSPADQQFLEQHFKGAPAQAPGEASNSTPTQQPKGTFIDEIPAGEMTYLVAYVPGSALPDTKLPTVCYITQTTAQTKHLKRLARGAEIAGWPVVMNTEAKGSLMKSAAPDLAESWLASMEENLPVDPERLFGAGYGSGMDALMLLHKKIGRFQGYISFCGELNGSGGAVPVSYCSVGINTAGRKSVSKGFDKKAPKGSLLRLTDAGRKNGNPDDYEDAFVFMAAHYYSNEGVSRSAEVRGFVDRALSKVESLAPDNTERAILWLHWLRPVRMTEAQKARFKSQWTACENEETQRYIEGLDLMQRFATRELADAGPSTDEESRNKLQKKIDRLTEQLEDTAWVGVLNAFE
ncbi:hypothetical protein [Sulfuriroseicoccus oceanibius]|uniref:SLA1 homology domain-containing protein n=1 Tax=Sulfuriroseicoccus oceanibius TaxID=2707525 RepID=A0A6B3LB80_9BACT|nr:hypothetical protein [Sulfuriroseicoccus oceanibius]QQL45525.1 hypothetical protein G3M56_002740 [Sulfuriroseicoccus oceanibius]